MAKGKHGPAGKDGKRKGKARSGEKTPGQDKELEGLRARLEALAQQKDELEDALAYARAEFENLRKRSSRDVENRVFRQKECLMLDLLDVVDNLERAHQVGEDATVDSITKGVRMIGAQLDQVLCENGLKAIDALGQEFDPFKHEAVERVQDPERPDNIVIDVLQKGYTLNGSVIRPSKVKVNVHPRHENVTVEVSQQEGGDENGKEEG